jgi:hypothetical protein
MIMMTLLDGRTVCFRMADEKKEQELVSQWLDVPLNHRLNLRHMGCIQVALITEMKMISQPGGEEDQ